MTRGALYHQFADKADLFAAVLDQVEAEIAQRVADAVAGFARDAFGTDVGEAFSAEEPASRGDERGPGSLGALLLGSSCRRWTL